MNRLEFTNDENLCNSVHITQLFPIGPPCGMQSPELRASGALAWKKEAPR